jgi:hypothetical protein
LTGAARTGPLKVAAAMPLAARPRNMRLEGAKADWVIPSFSLNMSHPCHMNCLQALIWVKIHLYIYILL